jgi:hypothetical protein
MVDLDELGGITIHFGEYLTPGPDGLEDEFQKRYSK